MIIGAIIVVLVLALPRFFQVHAVHTIGGTAPNNNQWTTTTWAPSDNTILGTAQNTTSDVWFTGSNGNPNDADTIQISNGSGTYDERSIVDMGFLELVRQGIYPANSPYISSSLQV